MLSKKVRFKKGIAESYLWMGVAFSNRDMYDSALYFLAKVLAETIDKKIAAKAHNSIGNIYQKRSNYSKALENHLASLKIREEVGDKQGISASANNIGNVYSSTGNYPEALKNFFISLKIKEEMGDKLGVAFSLSNIGNVYNFQGNYQMALKNFLVAMKMAEEIGDKQVIATTYNNIGIVYFALGNYPEALKNHLASLKIREEMMDKLGIAASYNNIANVNCRQNNYSEALKNYFASLRLREEMGDKQGLAESFGNIGYVYITKGKAAEAKEWWEKALQLSKKIGFKEVIKNSYQGLAETDSALATSASNPLKLRWKYAMSALENYRMYVLYKDSLINEETIKKSERERNQYEFDKKEAAAEAERLKKDAIVEVERKKQHIILWSVIGGLLLVVLFAVFIFRSLRITKKQKRIIEQQKDIVDVRNQEIEEQKKIVEEKNRDITDSINYARRIQQAKLPEIKQIQKVFPDSFVLFKPKDIVSGDFYYFHFKPFMSSLSTEDMNGSGVAFIAAADCTGHGVPGAFMSMIGSEILDEAIIRSSHTSEILSFLNHGIKKSLHQTGEYGTTRDGMDIAMCALEFPLENERMKLKYAAANRPLWIIRKYSTEVEEIKATKKAIGGFTENDQHFDTHEIELRRGDTFYIFSDGYADTFGGKEQKKIMTKKFKELLLEVQNKPMMDQEIHLNNFVEDWKSGIEQVDDILIIGVRV